MLSFHELSAGLRKLEIDPRFPLLVHASLSSLGEVRGGADTVLAALLACSPALIMPTFTYRTMLTPEAGPANNGLEYGTQLHQNRQAQFFTMDFPADPTMGILAEKLRRSPNAQRSRHPILSFSGINVSAAIESQTLAEPLNLIGALARQGAWVMLIGVNHTVNTSIHYAERLATRKQFMRWALTYEGVLECPGFPGCSNGFDKLGIILDPLIHRAQIGSTQVQVLPLQPMLTQSVELIHKDPLALLCDDPDCERCSAVRAEVFHFPVL